MLLCLSLVEGRKDYLFINPMKAIPSGHYTLHIEAENDAERVWLQQMIGGFSKDFIDHSDTEVTVNLEDMCVRNHNDNEPAVDMTLEEAMSGDEKEAWGLVDRLSIHAGGL